MSARRPGAPDPGLCGECRHVRIVASRRGSRFYLCERSREDDSYPRYPRLPVVQCPGFERRVPDGAANGPAREASDSPKKR